MTQKATGGRLFYFIELFEMTIVNNYTLACPGLNIIVIFL